MDSDVYDQVYRLYEKYRGLRLAISSRDHVYVFISVFLSKATDFHYNTVVWVRKLLYDNPSVDDIVRRLPIIGTSFQLKQLHHLLSSTDIISTIDMYSKARCNEVWELRKRLLRYRWVGVKTVDAYILFTTRCPAVAPIDRHYRRFLLDYFSLPKYMKPPRKDLCIRWSYGECPLRNRCLFNWAYEKLGELNGWVQTVSYLLGSTSIRS